MKTTRAGPMRHQIDIMERTETPDGSGGLPTTDSLVETVWASIEQVRERVENEFGRIDDMSVYQIRTRYSSNIDEDKKIEFDGRTFEILSVENVLEIGKDLLIRAVEAKA